ncbi:MAG: hypothetical protein AB7G24_10310 [Novosphingobium sp.]
MIKPFDTQLQVALRALNEVVAPALTGAEKHVVEQLHLTIATLGFVKERLPQARRYYRMELRSFLDLAAQAVTLAGVGLADACAGLDDCIGAAEALLLDPEADLPDYEAATGALRDGIARLSSEAAGTPRQQELERLILNGSRQIIEQSRVWCVPFGFEPAPDALPAAKWL